jgi:ABC-type phosphate transport system permease subunit
MLRLSLAFPACIAEGLTARASIRRSGRLTRRAKGRIFLVLLVVFAACYALALASILVVFTTVALGAFAFAAVHLTFHAPWSYMGFGLIAVVWLCMMFLWVAFPWASSMTALAVLYRDQRLRVDSLLPPAAPQSVETTL